MSTIPSRAALEITQRIAASGLTLDQGYVLEDKAKVIIMATEDACEGPRAFMQERAPVYKGV